jgi:hypothetical protein
MPLEKLGDDYLDVGTLHRFGIFRDNRSTWRPFLRWPDIAKSHADRYRVELEMPNTLSEP